MTLRGNLRLLPTPGYHRVSSNALLAGLELTDGRLLPVSQADEARLRLNGATSRLEVSIDGAAYSALTSDAEAGVFRPENYGAVGDDTTDCTSAIATCEALAAAAGGVVRFGPGVFRHTGIVVRHDGMRIEGTRGTLATVRTVLRFDPPNATAVALEFGRNPITIYPLEGCELRDIALTGDGSEAVTNSLLNCRDCREFRWERCNIYEFGGIGILWEGRDTSTFEGVDIACARPIVVRSNPAAALGAGDICDLDHVCFRDAYLWGTDGAHAMGVTYPLVLVETDLHVNSLTFEGVQAWVGGLGGLEWIDTGSIYASHEWHLRNIRYEQASPGAPGGWAINIDKTGGQPLIGLEIQGCEGGSGAAFDGIRMRNVWSPTITNYECDGDATVSWLDVDDTVTHLSTFGCVAVLGAQLTLSGDAAVVWSLDRGKGPGTHSVIDNTDPTDNPAQWSEHYGIRHWSWSGWLDHGSSKIIPCGADRAVALIEAWATPGDAAGSAAIQAVEDMHGGFVVRGTTHAGITDTNGTLCILPQGGSANPLVKNNLGVGQMVGIDVKWRSVNIGGFYQNLYYDFDYDSEAGGVADWTVINAATLTKSATSPHTGTQALRIAFNGSAVPGCYNNGYALVPGLQYTFRGWARGDAGTGIPQVNDGGAMLWSGSNSVLWQWIDVTFVAVTTHVDLYNLTGAAGWVEYDDLELFGGAGP